MRPIIHEIYEDNLRSLNVDLDDVFGTPNIRSGSMPLLLTYLKSVDNRLNVCIGYTIQPVVQPALTTGCIVYTNIQPVVKPV